MQAVRMTSPAVLIVCLLSTLSYSATQDRITGAMSGGQTVELSGSVHHKAQLQFDRGLADPALRFGSMTLLTLPTVSQRRALAQLVQDQQNPKSPNYHKWLTPQQWADRFGLSQNDIKRITDWLEGQGFQVTYVAQGRNWISFSGTAVQVQSAFGTEIHQYFVNGEMHVANAAAPKIPGALAGVVTGIRGLNDFHLRPRSAGPVRPSYNNSRLGNLIAPGDIATMYDIKPLYNASTPIDGTGQKLAVIGQTDVDQADLKDFRSGFGLSTIACTLFTGTDVIKSCSDPHFKYTVVTGLTDPGAPLTTGDLSEADLDIEWSGAVARNAQIVYVNAPATFSGNNLIGGGVWQAWNFAVDSNIAPVISLSYGTCEFGDNNVLDPSTGAAGVDEVELQKANSFGITFVNSSGDAGAAECDNPTNNLNNGNLAQSGLALGYPASSPEVTGVGGTSLSIADLSNSSFWGTTNATDGGTLQSYVPEGGWNDDAEIGLFCASNPTNTFCSGNHVTDQKSAQAVIGMSSGGGGPSNCAKQTTNFQSCVSGFPQPSYQSTLSISGQPAVRYSPDVGLLATANFPGFIFCTELSELGDSGTGSSCANGIESALGLSSPSVIGGTSASAPIFAGIVALMNQALGGSGQGNINPVLYKLAATPSNKVFNQVKTGTNTVYCSPGTPSVMPAAMRCPSTGIFGFDASQQVDATTGYNFVTGLGSVDVAKLATAWAATVLPFTMSAGAASPSSVMAGGSATSIITIAPASGTTFTGSVTLSCPNAPMGITCSSFSTNPVTGGSGTATVTISIAATVAAGNYSVKITGTSGSASTSTTVSLTVTATNQSFTMSTDAQTYIVTQGGQATVKVSWTTTNGFNLPLTFSCTDPASESTCLGPTGPQNASPVSFTISTTAATASSRRPFDRGSRIFYAALLPGLLGIVFVAGSRKRSLRGMKMLGLMMVLGASTLWLGSCGGSSNSSTSNPGTPKQTYTFLINATTGGSAPIKGNSPLQFMLTVQ